MSKRFFLFISIFLLSAALFGSEPDKPLWVRINEGKSAVDRGQLGEAAFIFREILKDNPSNPEAEKWLGLIFEREGEYELAIKQFEKTLENRNKLTVLEDRYYILYHMGTLYRKTGHINDYKKTLEVIIKTVKEEEVSVSDMGTMANVLETKGIDKFFELYRPSGRITLEAHRLLGKEYFIEQNYTEALKHLILASGEPVSVSIEEIKKDDPLYSFADADDSSPFEKFIQTVMRDHRLRQYMEKVEFFDSLYLAGMSVYELGYRKSGLDIIYFVMTYADDIPLRNKARIFYTGNYPVQTSP